MTENANEAQLAALWRIESAKIVGAVMRIVRDVGVAEEIASSAFVAALETWPTRGVPDKPGAWLMQTAKNRALDHVRRETMKHHKEDAIVADLDVDGRASARPVADVDEDERGLDVLRLLFVSCHPVLSPDARAALTLRVVGGLTTAEIARAFVVPEPTIAQRIVRAKKTLADEKVAFEVPSPAEMPARLESVLQVIYLVFNEGYAATAGDDWMRPALCDDALRLGRMLAALMPDEPEVHGLLALMEIQASRTRARTSSTGDPILLLDQDRGRWDQAQIRRGLQALARAEAAASTSGRALGSYTLQAAIAGCHAVARDVASTDWRRIAVLYEALVALTRSPIVELNRAVAVSYADGPKEALAIVDAIADALSDYALFYAVRADLLAKLGKTNDARKALEKAASLTSNAKEKALLLDRAHKLAH